MLLVCCLYYLYVDCVCVLVVICTNGRRVSLRTGYQCVFRCQEVLLLCGMDVQPPQSLSRSLADHLHVTLLILAQTHAPYVLVGVSARVHDYFYARALGGRIDLIDNYMHRRYIYMHHVFFSLHA